MLLESEAGPDPQRWLKARMIDPVDSDGSIVHDSSHAPWRAPLGTVGRVGEATVTPQAMQASSVMRTQQEQSRQDLLEYDMRYSQCNFAPRDPTGDVGIGSGDSDLAGDGWE